MTTITTAAADAAEGAGSLIASFLNDLPPERLDRLQGMLQAGCHLGVRLDFAADGLHIQVFAQGDETVAVLFSATMPPATPTHTH